MNIKLNGSYSSMVMQNMSLSLGFPIRTIERSTGIITVSNEKEAAKVLVYLKSHGYPTAEIMQE